LTGCSRLSFEPRQLANINNQAQEEVGLSCLFFCISLTSLSLTKIPGVTDGVVSGLAQHCPYLQILSLQNCIHVTDVGIKEISQCSQLRDLDIAYNSHISEAGLTPVALNCRHLEVLNVRLLNLLSMKFFALLATKCSRLTSLIIGGVTNEPETLEMVKVIRKLHPDCHIKL